MELKNIVCKSEAFLFQPQLVKKHYHDIMIDAWWRHQMETFSALLALCAGNSPVTGEFPSQGPVTLSFDVFFDLHLNKRWSTQFGDLIRHRAHYDVTVMVYDQE